MAHRQQRQGQQQHGQQHGQQRQHGSLSHIQVIGSLNIDLVTTTPRVPDAGETLTARTFATFPGGKGANQAIACARAHTRRAQNGSTGPDKRGDDGDISVSMVGAVGQDAYGDLLLSTLTGDGVRCDGVSKLKDTNTGVAVIIVEEESGENRILITPGANGRMLKGSVSPLTANAPSEDDAAAAAAAAISKPDLIVMQLEIPHETVLDIIAQAREAQVDVLLNPAPAVKLPDNALDGLAHLVLNETEAAILCDLDAPAESADLTHFLDQAFSRLAAKGVKNIVITLGGSGVAFCTPESGDVSGWQRVEASKVDRVLDTTAAGDTFVGYYAVGLVRSKRTDPSTLALEPIVAIANKAAALTVTRQGAMGSIPYSDELEP